MRLDAIVAPILDDPTEKTQWNQIFPYQHVPSVSKEAHFHLVVARGRGYTET
jgi:hypothetical protein